VAVFSPEATWPASEEPMAEDKKKSRIDLKARLGKTTTMVGTNAPAVPMPVPGPAPSTPGSVPPPSDSNHAAAAAAVGAPPVTSTGSGSVRPPPPPPPAALGIAPPLGMSPGIPPPLFGHQPRPAPAATPKPTAAQQTIKVEVSEEVENARKKAGRWAIYAALAGALVGGVLGVVIGTNSERGGRLKEAARGASLLEKDVKAATEKMKELENKLTEAGQKLTSKQFPETLAADLGGINIPFDPTNLDGKQVGSLPTRILRNLLAFTSAVQEVNKSKDSLKNILSAAQGPITKAWKEEKEPVANFSVLFRGEGQNKMVAELVPNKEPFSWKGDFPAGYSITKLENNKPAEKKATRWVKGDLVGTDPIVIPVDPKTTAAFTNEVLVQRLNLALRDIRQDLQGNKDDPTQETAGLIKDGEDLANELRKASLNQ
jgi:hypothetical protein